MLCFVDLDFENILLLIIDHSGVTGKLDSTVVMSNGEKLIQRILRNCSFTCIVFVNQVFEKIIM